MFRSFFIYLSKSSLVRRIVTRWGVAWRMASRFISGEKIEDAIRVTRKLNSSSIHATLDHLGEHTTNAQEAEKATRDILETLDAIDTSGVKANVSIKLTQIGLSVDPEACTENLRRILSHANLRKNFIRIDMEDSAATQITLDLLLKMHEEGFTNMGIVIQAYLYRSEKDIQMLIDNSIPVRLCKGAYKEPAEVAFPKKKDVDRAFDQLSINLLKAAKTREPRTISEDGRFPPFTALATHDEKRIRFACETAEQSGLNKKQLEFQMLHGIRRDLQQKLARDGYPVRIYVPYGTEWYPYYMRRLAERPANVWFFLSNLLQQ